MKDSSPKAGGSTRKATYPRRGEPILIWVPWLPTAPNKLRHAHWTVVSRSVNDARKAWESQLNSSSFVTGSLVAIRSSLRSSPCEISSLKTSWVDESASLTTIHESNGATIK